MGTMSSKAIRLFLIIRSTVYRLGAFDPCGNPNQKTPLPPRRYDPYGNSTQEQADLGPWDTNRDKICSYLNIRICGHRAMALRDVIGY